MGDDSNPRSKDLWVSAALDDFTEIDPYAFRLYAHIIRRCNGQPATFACYESLPNMARAIGINERTVKKALKKLEAIGAVILQERKGYTSRIAFMSIEDFNTYWKERGSEWRSIRKETKGKWSRI